MNSKIFHESAWQIANDFICAFENANDGLFWKSLHYNPADKSISYESEVDLYRGVGGVLLFLVELHRTKNDARLLDVIKRGTEMLLEATHSKGDNYAFYTGKTGVGYLLLRVYSITKDRKYLKEAAAIFHHSERFFTGQNRPYDLINGTAGTLLGLLHYYKTTKDDSIIPKIELFIQYLLKSAIFGDKGIYWEKTHKHINGLCGFSHGSSGIGWVLMEAGELFNNRALIDFAEHAFHYENSQYSPLKNNWPDFRNGVYDQESFLELSKKYKEGDYTAFFEPSYMIAWCHGAPGIGLSRIRAYQITANKKWRDDYLKALRKTRNQLFGASNSFSATHTLCHGNLGNASLLLEGFRVFRKKNYLTLARRAGHQALQQNATYKFYRSGFSMAGDKEDISLFLGNAGIGYYFLELSYPDDVPSIVAPSPNYRNGHNTHPKLNIDSTDIAKTLVKTRYPNSSHHFQVSGIDLKSSDLKKSIDKFVKNETRNLISGNSELRYHLKIDRQIHFFERTIKSFSFEYVKDIVQTKDMEKYLEHLDKEALDNLVVKVGSFVSIQKGKMINSFAYSIVLKSGYRVQFYQLDQFEYSYLRKAKQSIRIASLRISIESCIDNDAFYELTKEYLKHGIIEIVNK